MLQNPGNSPAYVLETEKDEKTVPSYAKPALKAETEAAPPTSEMEKSVVAESVCSPPPGFGAVVADKTVSISDVVGPENENTAAKPEKSGVETEKGVETERTAPKTVAPIETKASNKMEITKKQANIMDKHQKTGDKPVMKHKQVTINLSQENVNHRGDNNNNNKKNNNHGNQENRHQNYKKSSQENQAQPMQGAFYPPQMMPQMSGPMPAQMPGQIPGQMPGMQVVYMMPTAAGGFQPVMAAPPGWQMAPQMAQGMPQMVQGMQPMQAAMSHAPMGMRRVEIGIKFPGNFSKIARKPKSFLAKTHRHASKTPSYRPQNTPISHK